MKDSVHHRRPERAQSRHREYLSVHPQCPLRSAVVKVNYLYAQLQFDPLLEFLTPFKAQTYTQTSKAFEVRAGCLKLLKTPARGFVAFRLAFARLFDLRFTYAF